jgi:hypothetical protein
MVHVFWHIKITAADGTTREADAETKGYPPDGKAFAEHVKGIKHWCPAGNERVEVTAIKPEEGERSGNPFVRAAAFKAPTRNDALFNAAGKQVNERHEVIGEEDPFAAAPPTPPAS